MRWRPVAISSRQPRGPGGLAGRQAGDDPVSSRRDSLQGWREGCRIGAVGAEGNRGLRAIATVRASEAHVQRMR